jgi:hypothetical protein
MATGLKLAVSDWSRTHTANLWDIPADITVGELLTEVRDEMQLPRETPFHLLYDGQKLNRTLTLEEIGIEDDAEVTIAPEVSAG